MSLQSTLRRHPVWVLVGIALLGAVAYVVRAFIGTLVFGLFLYYATRPVYNRIEGRVGEPSIAAGISIFALALPALTLVSYALLVVFRQFNDLTETAALNPEDFGLDPVVFERIADPAALASANFTQFMSTELAGSVVDSLTSAVETLTVLGIAAINLFAMVALAFYLLRDDHRIAAWLLDAFGEKGTLFRRYVVAVDRDLKDIFFGNILNAVFTGTIGVITYSLLNVIAPSDVAIPAAALVGLLAGVASLIPVVGMKLVYIPVGGYMAIQSLTAATTESLWFVVVFFVVSLVVVDSIPDLVLRPYVSGQNVHVGALMLSYTLGPLLFGWYGLFLMPVLLVLVIQFVRVVLPDLIADDQPPTIPLIGTPLPVAESVESMGDESQGVSSESDDDEPRARPRESVE